MEIWKNESLVRYKNYESFGKEDEMKIVITNAGDKGQEISKFLADEVNKYYHVANIVVEECWLTISECGPLRNEEFFPHGQVSFEIDFDNFPLGSIMATLTEIFWEKPGLEFYIPNMDIFWKVPYR